jgi:hypothetical protein
MMSKPTTAQLITAVREQLVAAVVPSIDDAAQQKLLAMIDHLLQTVAVRAEHEIDWMVNHSCDVVDLAEDMVGAQAAPPEVVAALSRYHEHHGSSLAASVVTVNYGLAGELLAAMLEATVSDTGKYGLAARQLLKSDVARGVQIVGEFELIPP